MVASQRECPRRPAGNAGITQAERTGRCLSESSESARYSSPRATAIGCSTVPPSASRMVGLRRWHAQIDRSWTARLCRESMPNLTAGRDTTSQQRLGAEPGIVLSWASRRSGTSTSTSTMALRTAHCAKPARPPEQRRGRPVAATAATGPGRARRRVDHRLRRRYVSKQARTVRGARSSTCGPREAGSPEEQPAGVLRRTWWIHAEARPGIRDRACRHCDGYVATPRVSKHRLFVWLDSVILPGLTSSLLSRYRRLLALAFSIRDPRGLDTSPVAAGTAWRAAATYNADLRASRRFRFPSPTPDQQAAIAAAAKELDELRNRWLNPPEWTKTEVLEFPGSVDGPWARYIDPATVSPSPVGEGATALARTLTLALSRARGASARSAGRGWCPRTPTVPKASRSGR